MMTEPLCRDCLSNLIPIDDKAFVCENCQVYLFMDETATAQASKDISEVIRLCRYKGGANLKEAVNDAFQKVAANRRKPLQTIRDSCTRRIGLTGPGATDRFEDMIRKILEF